MQIDPTITVADLAPKANSVLHLAADKVRGLERSWQASQGAPVFTVDGQYTSRGWTEWTEGFQYGCALLAFDGTGDEDLLELGRRHTVDQMAVHVTHTGVHDHGFNTVSTYGNLRRLLREGRFAGGPWELGYYELAIKASGAVQAARWSPAGSMGGYIYSFNGPHSLFIDTLRTLRVLALAHQLGHVLRGENDQSISLLDRLVRHGLTSAEYLVWYGTGRDIYDVRGRTAHEGIFNLRDGCFRCPSTQQGYSPFSTWTRGLAWALLGFAEQLEFLETVPATQFEAATGHDKSTVVDTFEKAALATGDFYIDHAACADGVCYWDTGAPGLHQLGDFLSRPADPMNPYEPVDASAAAIAAQGLIRLSRVARAEGDRYERAGLTVARTLLGEPYLATNRRHQGLLLHSIYHRPNGWDAIPAGQQGPYGESSMWGDYHLIELAILIQRIAQGGYLAFFDNMGAPA
jgi:unsaturated chondroitin disaccharide hydrolase